MWFTGRVTLLKQSVIGPAAPCGYEQLLQTFPLHILATRNISTDYAQGNVLELLHFI
jgi:hypothetical protein